MIVLNISEEYGCDHWYAVMTEDRYEELKREWQTIKGLNCLVPVRFLIPEASNFPLKPEHAQFADEKYIENNDVKVVNSHIHQCDDSYLEGVDYEIPEGEFEFKGKSYSEDDVYKIFRQYRDEEDKIRGENEQESQAPDHLELGLEIDAIHYWPEDVALPNGWVRTEEGIVQKS
jgi:hypothetical protein